MTNEKTMFSILVIAAVTAGLGMSAVVPAMASPQDDAKIVACAPNTYNPSTDTCVKNPDACPDGYEIVEIDGTRYAVCLDTHINDNTKTVLCHNDTKSGKEVTIEVSDNAVPKHLEHGDTEGICELVLPPQQEL